MRWRASAADGSWRPESPSNLTITMKIAGKPHRRRQREVVEEGVAAVGVLLDAKSVRNSLTPADPR